MTTPRNVRPGKTWFVTRRATRRHHLFSPDELGVVEQIYWYVTAVYARVLGIEIHMVQVMSSHIHEVLTDTLGVLPRFFELRNRALANALKVFLGWPEEVFSKTSANWVELVTPEAVVQQTAYTIANCVAAQLVRTPRRWPGVKVLAEEMGRRVVTAKRPEVYFDPTNPNWPDEASLALEMPALLMDAYGGDADACRAAVQVRVDELVRKAHIAAETSGRGFVGRKRVLKMPHTARASSYEEFGGHQPTVATGGNREAARAFARERRAFLHDYRSAWQSLQRGEPAVFPYGTWKMRVCNLAPCHPPP